MISANQARKESEKNTPNNFKKNERELVRVEKKISKAIRRGKTECYFCKLSPSTVEYLESLEYKVIFMQDDDMKQFVVTW